MQNTDLILLKNNKYKYISTEDSSSLIYKDGYYYPARFTQVSKTFKQEGRDIVNKEIPLYAYTINSYVSDIITYHYLRVTTSVSNIINNIEINCYVDDELINKINFYPQYELTTYAYPTATFNINKYVHIYKETLQINSSMTSPNVDIQDNIWWYIWSISNKITQ